MLFSLVGSYDFLNETQSGEGERKGEEAKCPIAQGLLVSRFEGKTFITKKSPSRNTERIESIGMRRLTTRMFLSVFSSPSLLTNVSLFAFIDGLFPSSTEKPQNSSKLLLSVRFCVPNSFNIIHGSFFRF
jgi:hypothetical protein